MGPNLTTTHLQQQLFKKSKTYIRPVYGYYDKTKMFKTAVERYKAPTPLVYELIGDIILIVSVILDGALIAIEVDPKWIIVNSLLGAAGKIFLRLAKFKEAVEPIQQDNKEGEVK